MSKQPRQLLQAAADRVGNRQLLVKLLVLLPVVGLLYVWRPLFHPVIYRMVYSPGGLYAVGLPVVVTVLLYLAPPLGDEEDSSAGIKIVLVGVTVAVGIVLALALGGLGGAFEESHLANEAMENADQIDRFPEVNEANPRIKPRSVSDTQASGATNYPQHELGPSDVARTENGSLAWSYAIQPDQFQNRLNNNQRGVLFSDMTRSETAITAFDEMEFTHGRAMLFHRGAIWNLRKSDYWTQYRDDPIEFVHNGSAYMAYPKVDHEWNLLPVPHTTPKWGGVALVHQNGTIEQLSPDEARNHPVLQGQRLYPLYMAERYANSLKYRNGILNQLPVVGSFEGVVGPASMPSGTGNSQPFIVDMEGERLSYIYAMEPAGSGSGLAEVWFFDSRTGTPRQFRVDETLKGPERAVDKARSAMPEVSWVGTGDGGDGNARILEPVVTVVEGDLWWHVKAAEAGEGSLLDNANIFVRAGETGSDEREIVTVGGRQAVVEFISDGPDGDIGGPPDTGTGNDTTDISADADLAVVDGEVVVEIRIDGEVVDRIPLREVIGEDGSGG
jgi:hypothetical protein